MTKTIAVGLIGLAGWLSLAQPAGAALLAQPRPEGRRLGHARWLGRDRRGLAALEFGLIAPVLMLVTFATIEIGFLVPWTKGGLQSVAVLAARCGACEIDKIPRKWEQPSDHTPVIATLT